MPAASSRRRAYLTISILLVVVAVPLVANTTVTYLINVWTNRIHSTADAWLSQAPGASVSDVEFVSDTVFVTVQTPGSIPPVSELLDDLKGEIPNGIPVVVTTSLGEEIDAGVVGE